MCVYWEKGRKINAGVCVCVCVCVCVFIEERKERKMQKREK